MTKASATPRARKRPKKRRVASATGIRGLKPETAPYEAGIEHGLFIEVLPTGAKTFRFRYRLHGRREKVTIGPWLDVKEGAGTLAWARERHDEYRALVAAGKSPARAKRDAIANAGLDDSTFGGFVETRYLPEVVVNHKRPENDTRRLARHLTPVLKSRLLSEIETADILAIIDPIKAKGRVQEARQVLILAKNVFQHAIVRQKITRNPARDIPLKMIGAAGERERALTPDELRALFGALNAATFLSREHVIGIELLLLTMCRKGELLNAEWSHVDLDAAEWSVPAALMKGGKAHTVPLSPRAVELFRELKERACGSPFVLPAMLGRRDKPMAESTLNWAMKQITHQRDGKAALLTIPHFTLHDLRRTGSTLLNEAGFNGDWVEYSLAHAIPGVRGKYVRAKWLADRREMLNFWADFLDGLKNGNVIPLRAGKAA